MPPHPRRRPRAELPEPGTPPGAKRRRTSLPPPPPPLPPTSSPAPRDQALLERYALLALSRDAAGRVTRAACRLCPAFGALGCRPTFVQFYDAPLCEPRLREHVVSSHPAEWACFRTLPPSCAAAQLAFWARGRPIPDLAALRRLAEENGNWRVGNGEATAASAVTGGGAGARAGSADEATVRLGLVVVQRDKDGEEEWTACVFCTVFGDKRGPHHIEMRRGPIDAKAWACHFHRRHGEKWAEFRTLSRDRQDVRTAFWKAGKPQPDMAVLKKHAVWMQKMWDERNRKQNGNHVPEDRTMKRKLAENGPEVIDLTSEEEDKVPVEEEDGVDSMHLQVKRMAPGGHQQPLLTRVSSRTEHAASDAPRVPRGRDIGSHPERWAGRRLFQSGPGCKDDFGPGSCTAASEVQRDDVDICSPAELARKYLPRGTSRIDEGVVDLILNGELSGDNQHHLSELQCGFFRPGASVRPAAQCILAFQELCEEWGRAFAAVVLFYMLRGLSTEVISMLTEDVLEAAGRTASGRNFTLGAGATERCQTGISNDSRSPEHTHPVPGDATQEESEDDDDEPTVANYLRVLAFGNCIVAEAMMLLKGLVGTARENWAVALATRRCAAAGAGAVEVLLSFHACGALQRVHLVCVQEARGAGEAVIRVLDAVCDGWRRRLLGICSQVGGGEPAAKMVERALLGKLRQCEGVDTGIRVVDARVPRGWKPIFPAVLAGMSDAQFRLVVRRHADALAAGIGQAAVIRLARARERIVGRRAEGEDEEASFRAAWEEAGKGAPGTAALANGLATLWLRGSGGRVGLGEVVTGSERVPRRDRIVDGELEHVLWARVFVRLRAAAE